jgi:PAS domain S-box-containing protein
MEPLLRRQPHRIVRERDNGAVLDVRGTPLPDGGHVLTYTDISAHLRNEREALRFRAALDLSNDGIYLADVQRLVIVDVNAGACRALGYTREELIGLSVEKIFADRTLEQMREQYGRIAAGDDSRANFEAVHRRKDGSVFPVEISRRVHHTPAGPLLVGVARDISAHKQAQEALRGSEETLRVIVEDALDAAVRIDAEGLVIGWNAQAERSFGWSAAEAHGRRLSEMIVPQRHRAGHEHGMRRFLATGEGPVLNRRIEMHALRRDGQEIPVELSVTPVRTAGGWVFSAFLRDLTAARASEAARATLESQLREAQKMEAIGTLAGGIAHDFNNILAAILANAEFARQALAGSELAQAELAQIRQSAQRARSLVQQILAFGRRQDQRLRALPLAPLVEEVRALMRALLPPCDEPLWVRGDPTQLQQVLMNLCTNGWQALQGRAGEIEIGLAAVHEGGTRQAHLWVRDTGSGMDAATRARIFEPFYTTKPVGQGTGLGLSVVHGIVASHQGRIGVDSTPGAGSCFHVYLPLVPPEAAATGPGALAEAAAGGQGEHVLVIDDDETMALVVERLLGRAGYRVTTCLHATEGVDLVRRSPEGFDLVVTDYNMPGLSGFDVVRELALARPGLPVVVSSGYVTEAMRAEAQAIGVRALLRKENTIEELAALVRAVIARPAADPP